MSKKNPAITELCQTDPVYWNGIQAIKWEKRARELEESLEFIRDTIESFGCQCTRAKDGSFIDCEVCLLKRHIGDMLDD